MKYSLALVAYAATTISALAFPMPQGGSRGSCDTSDLETCVTPLLSTVEDCGTDLTCLCSAVQTLVSCYDAHCPGQEPSEVTQAISACNGAGEDFASATSEFGSASSRFASATSRGGAFGDDDEEPTSTGDDFPSETSSADDDDFEETTTRRVIDPESTATETESVTATRSADDDEETSSAEDDDSETTAAPVSTTTRRPNPTGSAPPTQSTGAAENLAVPALGGMMALAVGAVALL